MRFRIWIPRKFIDSVKDSTMMDRKWYEMIDTVWFKDSKENPQSSGFEHVIVGEQKGAKLGGYHFWYKYYLDDQAKEGYANGKDNMRYNGLRYSDNIETAGTPNPDVVTSNYNCAEGLIALGLVLFYDPELSNGTVQTVINGRKYDLKLFKDGPEKSSIKTFYPIFKIVVSENTVRIVAALVNPDGMDAGKESVTLRNDGSTPVRIEGWTIAGNNNNAYKLIQEGLLGAGKE